MGLFTKDIRTLDDLFKHQLRDVYYAELRIEKTLPDMIRRSTSPDLRQGLETFLAQTREHIANVEAVFRMHDVEIDPSPSPAIDGIIKDAEEVASEVGDRKVLDAALIASAQAVDHYEMTRYGTLVTYANRLGLPDCASVLEQNLEGVKVTDASLTRLAETQVSRLAV